MELRKIFAIAMVSVLAVTTFAGCGKSGTGEEGFVREKTISVLTREDSSGTRGAFIELMGIEQKDEEGNKIDKTMEDAVQTNSTSIMMTSVAGDIYGIGYISLGSLNDTVKAVKIDGVEATVANIKAGKYAVARPFNIATKEEISEVAQDFIDFIMSTDGQAVIEEHGYIAVSDSESYAGNKPEGKLVVAGSSSVTPVMEKLKEAYEKVNTNASISIQESDSTTGMTSTIEGICDIGMASRELKDSEIEKGISGITIAMDGIAVIVNKDSIVENLTTEQVMKIYTGEFTKWSDVTG